MKTISKKKVSKTKKHETENQTFSSLIAVIETEFRFSEAIGIRKNEPSDYLKQALWQTSKKYPSNLYNALPTIFKTLDICSIEIYYLSLRCFVERHNQENEKV